MPIIFIVVGLWKKHTIWGGGQNTVRLINKSMNKGVKGDSSFSADEKKLAKSEN